MKTVLLKITISVFVGVLWRPCNADLLVKQQRPASKQLPGSDQQPLGELGSFGLSVSSSPKAQEDSQCFAPVAPPAEFSLLRSPLLPFCFGFVCLGLGYWLYGGFIDNLLRPDGTKETPALAMQDGMDYVPLSDAKVFLIQLLNIAGLGPIFGPILGSQFGPAAFAWIIIGCIFFGSVADYMVGMMSVRSHGASITTLVGNELGDVMKAFLNLVSLVLLVLVGVVFVKGPAVLLADLAGGTSDTSVAAWTGVIFVYYIIATLVPVDQVIGRVYPLFGAALIFMTLGLLTATIFSGREVPEMQFTSSAGVWPYPSVAVIISCSAISGFHATQTPMMARCIQSQTSCKKIFFGAMITEGVIGLIWAMSPLVFFGGQARLSEALVCSSSNPAKIVQTVLTSLLGSVGGMFSILGVVALPVTSGDTAFRSARLILAEILGTTEQQQHVQSRLMIAVPMFALAFGISLLDFGMIWQYFNFTNQLVAVMALWTSAAFLKRRGLIHWVASVPASILSLLLATYIFKSKEFGTGHFDLGLASALGAVLAGIWVCFMGAKLKSLGPPIHEQPDFVDGAKERTAHLVRSQSSLNPSI